MCKGCEITTKIAELYRSEGLFMPEGDGERTSPLIEDFDAAINGLVQVLSWIAAERANPHAFLRDVNTRLGNLTRDRVKHPTGVRRAPMH